MREKLLNARQAARELGVSERHLRRLLAEGLPKTARGIPISRARAWLAATRKAAAAHAAGGTAPRSPLERARLLKAAALARLSIRRARKLAESALPQAEAAAIIAEVRDQVATSFAATTRQVVGPLVGVPTIPVAFERLREGVNTLLAAAQRDIPPAFADASRTAPPPPAPPSAFATLSAAREARWLHDAQRIETEATLESGAAVLVDAHVREVAERLARLRATLFACLPRHAVQAQRLDRRGAERIWAAIVAESLAAFDSVEAS